MVMKRSALKAILIIGLLVSSEYANAQDIHFSQFYENAIFRNPALTGIFSGNYKGGVNYRTQWGALTNPFQTSLVSYESRVLVNSETNDYLSYGLCVSYDHAGSVDFNSLQVYPAINYNKSLEDRHHSYLSAGFTAGYVQRTADISKMTFDNQYQNGGYSPLNPTAENLSNMRVSHFDLGAGVSLNSSFGPNGEFTYYIGGGAYHVTQPKQGFDKSNVFTRLTTKFTGNLGVRYRITDEYAVIFHANYTNQKPYQEIIFGGLASWRPLMLNGEYAANKFGFYAGAFYRVKDAIVPTIKIDYNTYSFTASYDVTTSSLRPAISAKGGWEFSIYVRGYAKKQTNSMKCPQFEDDANREAFN
jgi:type IX secretion system PorP/SprF family membrane protein